VGAGAGQPRLVRRRHRVATPLGPRQLQLRRRQPPRRGVGRQLARGHPGRVLRRRSGLGRSGDDRGRPGPRLAARRGRRSARGPRGRLPVHRPLARQPQGRAHRSDRVGHPDLHHGRHRSVARRLSDRHLRRHRGPTDRGPSRAPGHAAPGRGRAVAWHLRGARRRRGRGGRGPRRRRPDGDRGDRLWLADAAVLGRRLALPRSGRPARARRPRGPRPRHLAGRPRARDPGGLHGLRSRGASRRPPAPGRSSVEAPPTSAVRPPRSPRR
jgi:hypothetical protein